MTIQWRIELLGGLRARRDEVSVTRFRTHKTGALLALLALSRQRHVRREEAIELLWPGETTQSGRSRLRMALTDLRKHLQSAMADATTPLLLADRQHLQLAPSGYVTDKDEFEALIIRAEPVQDETERIRLLTAATDMYTGELLAGYDEPWIVGERQRLADLYLLALRRLVKALATSQQLERALEYARRCVEADPLREESYRAVMQLYVAVGRPAMAQQQYRQLETTLQNELGVAPSASTRQLLDQCREALKRLEEATPPALTSASQASSSLADTKQTGTQPVSSGISSATVLPQPSDDPLLPPNNMPQPVTSFIGREQELAEVRVRLSRTRLLTITGSGGCGKTRLALEAARSLLSAYPDGVWLIELAPLTNTTLVPQAVAEALSIQEEAGKALLHTLVTFLKSKTILLVMDNCEHLLTACAQCAETLLRDCPNVTLLASSREPLNIAGESVYRVPSLKVPDAATVLTLSSLENYSALQLFVERASAISSTFRVDVKNLSALGQICGRLDGIPLAIELAAARVRSLSLEEINSKLDARFHLLTGGSRTALPRHQTLRALIDYSYDLLTAQEKTLLRCLSVFAGGWALETVEQFCSGKAFTGESIKECEVLDLLSSLVDKSLVIAEMKGQTTRYRLLQTVRHYAYDRLGSEESTTIRAWHRDYFLGLAEEVNLKLTGPDQAVWLRVLAEEHDNLRQALTCCLEKPEGGEKGLQLGAALQRFWWTHGHLREGREWLCALLSHSGGQKHTKARAGALSGAGVLAWMQGDYASARSLYEDSLTIYKELGDKRGLASSLTNLGIVVGQQGDNALARALYEESLALQREAGDKRGLANTLNNFGQEVHTQGDYASAHSLHEESLTIYRELGDQRGIAFSLNNLGFVAEARGDNSLARSQYEESLAIFRELEDKRSIANTLNNLGYVAEAQGDHNFARSLMEESLAIARDLGDRHSIVPFLEALGFLAMKEGNNKHSAQLWGAAAALREALGFTLSPADREKQERETSDVRETLGERAFATAWAAGHAMTLEQAVAYALNEV